MKSTVIDRRPGAETPFLKHLSTPIFCTRRMAWIPGIEPCSIRPRGRKGSITDSVSRSPLFFVRGRSHRWVEKSLGLYSETTNLNIYFIYSSYLIDRGLGVIPLIEYFYDGTGTLRGPLCPFHPRVPRLGNCQSVHRETCYKTPA